MKFQVGDRVLVNAYGIENEPAMIEEVDESDGEYWCIFDNGQSKVERSWAGLSHEEVRLDPGWFDEEQLQTVS